MKGYVYILASDRNGTLYVGVTSNPSRRWFEHQHALTPGFTSRYGVKRLVWLEEHDWVIDAIQREKNIKKYPRRWKLNLIESINPEWDDLSSWLFDT
jgi:putative endonuclease